MNPTKTQIFLFDFDGTLTTRDTLLAFLRFAKGRWTLLGTLVLHLPLLLLNERTHFRLLFQGYARGRF